MEEKVNELLRQISPTWIAMSAGSYFETTYLTLYEKLLKVLPEDEAERVFLALVKDEQ